MAKGQDPLEFGKRFDTLTVCFSKGLGTPLGTVLVGDQELMDNAIRVRKVLGGGMRQIGYMAAACLYALDNHVERLAEDHQKAKEIGELLESLPQVTQVSPVETNIVIFHVRDEATFSKAMADRNIIISNMGQGALRVVTHLDYTAAMHENFLNALRETLS